MTQETVNATGVNAAALTELQGRKVAIVAGAAAGTKMAIAAMRYEDTLLAVLSDGAGSADVEDLVANCSVFNTRAKGTLTISSTGPTNGQTLVINGVTYTFKTAGTAAAATDVNLGGSTSVSLDNLVAAVNAYECRRTNSGERTPDVVAEKTSSTVVTIRAVIDGAGNGLTITDSGTTFTSSGTAAASATLQCTTVIADDYFVLNGVTFTVKATPTDTDLQPTLQITDALMATEIARCLNAYAEKYQKDWSASALTDTVTIVPATAKKGNLIVLTESCSNLVASGSGTLAGGTATGGFTSTDDLTGLTLTVHWADKHP